VARHYASSHRFDKGLSMDSRIDSPHPTSLCDAQLVVVGAADESLADSIGLTQLPFTIGRSHDNRVVLSHRLVSRVHCEIFQRDGRLFVRDLGSLNGTFVGNQRISECELQPGDLLTVGVVTFRAVYGNYDFESSLDSHAVQQNDQDVLDTIPVSELSAEATLIHKQLLSTHRVPPSGNGQSRKEAEP
jgi:pSer/pThr/pTyr-binding forkhead associated (FHA) protein